MTTPNDAAAALRIKDALAELDAWHMPTADAVREVLAQNAALVEALETIRVEAEAGFEVTANSRWEIVHIVAQSALALARPKEEPDAE